jgi:hypothetical protein
MYRGHFDAMNEVPELAIGCQSQVAKRLSNVLADRM